MPIRPEPDEFERTHRGEAGLFAISGWQDLNSLELAVAGDANSEITILALSDPTRHHDLLTSLRAPQRPSLADVLAPGELMIDLAIVRDRFLGLTSYFFVKSPMDVGQRLRAVCDHYNEAWNRYLGEVDGLRGFEDFNVALQHLLTSW